MDTAFTAETFITTDTGELIENTVYTMGAYTLTRFTALDNGYTYWETECEDVDLPEVTPMGHRDSPEYGVNLNAQGDKNTAEASDYIRELFEAVEVAEVFTAIRAEHDSK